MQNTCLLIQRINFGNFQQEVILRKETSRNFQAIHINYIFHYSFVTHQFLSYAFSSYGDKILYTLNISGHHSIYVYPLCCFIVVSQKFFVSDLCGVTYLNTPGILKSPGYPYLYSDNLDCEWTIFATGWKRIFLQFLYFSVSFVQQQRNKADNLVLLCSYFGVH